MQNKEHNLSVAKLNMRTTSSIESLNSQLQRTFKRHGNIFKFVESLQLHEYSKVLDIKQLHNSEPAKQMERRKNSDKERDAKIKYFSGKLEIREIDVTEFLEAMSNKMILPATGSILPFLNLQNCFLKLSGFKKKSMNLAGLNAKSKAIRKMKRIKKS